MFGNNFTGKSRETNFTLARDRITSRTENIAAVRAQREARLEWTRRQAKATMIQSRYRGYITRKELYTFLRGPRPITTNNNITNSLANITTPETPSSRLALYICGIAAVNIVLKMRKGDDVQYNGRNSKTLISQKYYLDLKKWLEKEIFANSIRHYSSADCNDISTRTVYFAYTIVVVLSTQCATYLYPDEARKTINSAMTTMENILLQLHPGQHNSSSGLFSPYYLVDVTISHLSKYLIVALLQLYNSTEGVVLNPSHGDPKGTSSPSVLRVDIVMRLFRSACLLWVGWVSTYNTVLHDAGNTIDSKYTDNDKSLLELPKPWPPSHFIAAILAIACSCAPTARNITEGDDEPITSCAIQSLLETVHYFLLNKNVNDSAANTQLHGKHVIVSGSAPMLVVSTFACFYRLYLEDANKINVNNLNMASSFPYYFVVVVLGNNDICTSLEDSFSIYTAVISTATGGTQGSPSSSPNNECVCRLLESLLGMLASSIHRSIAATSDNIHDEDNNIDSIAAQTASLDIDKGRNVMIFNYWYIAKALLSPSRTKEFGTYFLRAATAVPAIVSPCSDSHREVNVSIDGNNLQTIDNTCESFIDPRDLEVIQQLSSEMKQLPLFTSNATTEQFSGGRSISLISEETEDNGQSGFYTNILSLLGETVFMCTHNLNVVSMHLHNGNREIDHKYVLQAIESSELIDSACSVFILPWLQLVEGSGSNSDRRRMAIPMLSKLSNFMINEDVLLRLESSLNGNRKTIKVDNNECGNWQQCNGGKVPLLRILWEALCALVKFPIIQMKTDLSTLSEATTTASDMVVLSHPITPIWSAIFSGGVSLGNMLQYSHGWDRGTLMTRLKEKANEPTSNKFRAELPFLALTFLNTFNFYVQSSDLAISLRTSTFNLCSPKEDMQPADHPLLSLISGLREVVLKSHMTGCDVTDAEIRLSVAYRTTSTANQARSKEGRGHSGNKPIPLGTVDEVISPAMQFIRQTGGEIATVEVAQAAHLLLLRLHIIDESTNYIKPLIRAAKLDTTVEMANIKKLPGVAGKCVSWWSTPIKRYTFPASIGLDQWIELTILQKVNMNQSDIADKPETTLTDPSRSNVAVAAAAILQNQQQDNNQPDGTAGPIEDNIPLLYPTELVADDLSDDSDSDGLLTQTGLVMGRRGSRISSDIRLHSKLLKLRFEHSVRWSMPQRVMTLLQHCPFLVPFSNRVGIFSSLMTESCQRDVYIRDNSRSEIIVTRGQIFEDAFHQVRHISTETLRKHRLPVRFRRAARYDDDDDDGTPEENEQEDRVEAGYGDGIFREFMLNLCQEGFGSVYGLFKEAHGRDTRDLSIGNYGAPPTVIGLYPHPQSPLTTGAGEEGSLDRLHFLGQMVGKALRDGILVDVAFAGFFRNLLLGRQNGLADLPSFDGEMFDSFRKMREMAEKYITNKQKGSHKQDNANPESEVFDLSDPIEDLGLYFTATIEQLGVVTEIPLIPGGTNLPVTAVNLNAYIHLLVDFRLNREIKKQSDSFRSGLYSMVDPSWLKLFDSVELQVVFRGGNDDDDLTLDIIDWRNSTKHRMLDGDTLQQLSWRVVEDFWHVVQHELTPNQQRLLLKFVTSLSRAPLLGFKHMNPRFCINVVNGPVDRLPSAATCMCLLELPCYPNRQVMKEKILRAIEGTDTFELV